MLSVQQPGMQSHDELAALFARNLTLEATQPRQEPAAPITYSISQHYHHSAHMAKPREPETEQRQQQQQQQSASSGSSLPDVSPSAETILAQFKIDATKLSLSQLQLFRTADDPQKMRLIELWQIAPPSGLASADTSPSFASTSVEREEALARMRYEQEEAEKARAQEQNCSMSLDGTIVPLQGGDGRWLSVSYMEPYMESGYEQLSRREYELSAQQQQQQQQHGDNGALDARPRDVYTHFGVGAGGPSYNPATDPVYQCSLVHQDLAPRQEQQTMEDQYGAFVQFRDESMQL